MISANPAGTASGVHVAPAPSTHIAAPPTPSSGIPVIVALDRLLAGVGLEDDKVDASALGLGDGPSSTADGLLNTVNIGSDGLQPRKIATNATADVDPSLLDGLHASGLIGALLKPVLDLNATHCSLAETSSSVVDPSLVGDIVKATISLPLGSIYADVVAQTVVIVTDTILLLNALESYQDLEALELEPLYDCAIKVVDAALALQEWCHAHPAPYNPPLTSSQTSSPTTHASASLPSTTYLVEPPTATHTSAVPAPNTPDEPIIIGLTKILNVDGTNVVVGSGLLGNNIDHLVNSMTDSAGIGPNGARRRFAHD